MAHRAVSDQTLGVELEPVPSHHLIGQSRTVDRGNKLDALLLYLQRGRNGRITTVGEEGVGFVSGNIETFYDRKGLPHIGSGGAMDFIVGDDLLLSVIIARLGNLRTISGTFASA